MSVRSFLAFWMGGAGSTPPPAATYHVRKQLRDAVTTRVTGLTTTGSRVSGYRVNPLEISALPALAVWTPSENASQATVHSPGITDRTVEVEVDAIVAGTGDQDDALDAIAAEVETALLGSALSVGGKSVQLLYTGCEISQESGEKTVGVISMKFSAELFNAAGAPTTLIGA
jgi:hypothetical protein